MLIRLIVIVIILSILCSLDKCNIEGFKDINLDVIQYGKISKKIQAQADRNTITFKSPLPLKSIKQPDDNTSDKVIAELHYLSKLTSEKTSDEKRRMAKKFSRPGAVKNYFIKFAGEKGLAYDNKYINRVSKDIDTLTAGLQIYYNRPRPSQLGFLHQINIDTVGAVSTPSYPSGPSLKAHVLAYVMAYNNPTYKKQLEALAKKIELSQLYGGLNFPSDNITAIKVANIVKRHIKLMEMN